MVLWVGSLGNPVITSNGFKGRITGKLGYKLSFAVI
jgi:hypothetical protein